VVLVSEIYIGRIKRNKLIFINDKMRNGMNKKDIYLGTRVFNMIPEVLFIFEYFRTI
jgi:hypothetical protein